MGANETLQQAPEYMMYVRALVAFVFVISLIYLSAALVRKYGLDKRMAGVKRGTQSLCVQETLYLDPRRRLVLVRAGDKEHLLLLGPGGDVVVHSRDVKESQHAA